MWFKSKQQKEEEQKALEDRLVKAAIERVKNHIQGAEKRVDETAAKFSKTVNDAESGLKAQVAGLETRVGQSEADASAKLKEQSALARASAESAKKAETYAADAKKNAESAESAVEKMAEAAQAAFAKFEELKKENEGWRQGIEEYLKTEIKKIDAEASAIYNANVWEFEYEINCKMTAMKSSLARASKESKADYETIKATCIEDMRRLVEDCLGNVASSVNGFEKRKNEILVFYAENFRSISYCMTLPNKKRELLIEMHVSYNGDYKAFREDKEKQAKISRTVNVFDAARELILVKEIVEQQERFKFDAKEILYKIDETFRQAYDAAVAAKSVKLAQ